jgi:ADP-ribose pyrophosphatase
MLPKVPQKKGSTRSVPMLPSYGFLRISSDEISGLIKDGTKSSAGYIDLKDKVRKMGGCSMAKPATWKTTGSRYVHKSSFLKLRIDKCQSENLGTHKFYVLEYSDWVNIVPVTDTDEVVLVRQFRHGLEKLNLEIPGGIVDAGESPEAAIARELEEETGYVADRINFLSRVSVNPAIQNNWCHLYLAEGCRREKEQALEGTESIAVELVPLEDIPGMLKRGEIHHSLCCLALTLALNAINKNL